MPTLETIVNAFPITSEEYAELDSAYGNLCYYASWQLKKKNAKNSTSSDPEDDVQDLRIALMRAGSYYKRQTYIEQCFSTLEFCFKKKMVTDRFIRKLLHQLQKLWLDRRRHGANRQKFGPFQEAILERLIQKHVPSDLWPDKAKKLTIDPEFARYAKQIVWNEQKRLGKQITRDKSWRTGLVSLSDHEFLAGVE